MKTLKESLLDDIETTMNNGSKWAKEIEQETKEFLKVISTAKYWDGGYSLKNGRSNGVFVPNILHELGYDANHIHLLMYTEDSNGWISGSWTLEISLSKRSDDNMRRICTVWEKKIRITRGVADNWRAFIKNIIKPATKSLDTFKKLLDNMEKYNGRPIEVNLLLK
jgi:hypothetical protein